MVFVTDNRRYLLTGAARPEFDAATPLSSRGECATVVGYVEESPGAAEDCQFAFRSLPRLVATEYRPGDELLSRIQEFVDKSRGVAVALDEFDKLGDQTEVVYDLEMLSQDSDQHLGMVLVPNQGPERVRLDSRSESRLSCRTLQFEPYSADELVEILEERVEQAFRPGTVSDDVVREIAMNVAQRSGDCREALSRLLKLGREADRKGFEEVEPQEA